MLKDSLYERGQPRKPIPITIDKTTDKIKTMCIECILSTLRGVDSDSFRILDESNPFLIVLSNCIKTTGVRSESKSLIDEKKLEDLLYSCNDNTFYEMLEVAYHSIFEYYHSFSSQLSDDLNTIFERNYVGIRAINDIFVLIEEKTEYEEFIEPCLTILHGEGFDQANNHLCEAFDRYHEGDFKKAVMESSLALESVVNQILDELDIPKPEKNNKFDVKFRLLKENGVAIFQDYEVERFLQSVYAPIRARNTMPGVAHSGPDVKITEEEAQYVLGLATSSILYVVRCYQNRQ